jgi:hypothetical protein
MTIKDLNRTLGIMHTVYPYEDEYTEIWIEPDLKSGEANIVHLRTYDAEKQTIITLEKRAEHEPEHV